MGRRTAERRPLHTLSITHRCMSIALTIRIMIVQVTFQSEAEWSAELGALLDDLTATDGPNAGRVNLWVAEDAPSYPSWCKLYAVYGAAFPRDTQTNSRRSCRDRSAPRVTGEAFTHSREKSDTERGPDGRAVYKNPMLPVLRAKLERERGAPNISASISAIHLGPHSRAISRRIYPRQASPRRSGA